MTLAIDRGNTLTKVTLIAHGRVMDSAAVEDPDEVGRLAAWLWNEAEGAPRGICCSVAADDGIHLRSLLRDAPGDWLELTHATPLPIDIEYGTPGTLGLDRIAAACGAAAIAPGEVSLVADAGTALTLDLLDASGSRPIFRGGNISPGLRLRARALADHTGRLPQVDAEEGPAGSFLGTDTPGAILAGIYLGICGEIEAAFRLARLRYGASHLLLTGGDAQAIKRYAASLPCDPLAPAALPGAACLPNLLALGLSRIYDYNRRQ